jgi:hypothetical protein
MDNIAMGKIARVTLLQAALGPIGETTAASAPTMDIEPPT